MANAVLSSAAIVVCAHGGPASPTSASARLRVSGAPAVTISASYAISGCALPPAAGAAPCVSGRWVTGATRVASLGEPLAVADGGSLCAPSGAPMVAVAAQARVRAR